MSPDLYGHYREARYSQTKHHWWWKTNFVFSQIRTLRNYHGTSCLIYSLYTNELKTVQHLILGPVIFLEEDHYVAEDFLHVLWLQQQLLLGKGNCSYCTQARILSLGTYPKAFNHQSTSDLVSTTFCGIQ